MADTAPPATDDSPDDDGRPHKADLVLQAIHRGIPSYEAWDMTVPELEKRLES